MAAGTRRRESAAARADREAFEIELAMDIASSRSSWADDYQERGIPFADFECVHGRVGACHDCATVPAGGPR